MSGAEYFDHTTYPSVGAAGSSSAMRAELDLIEAGFGKLPDLSGNGGKVVAINSGGTAVEAITTTGTGSGVRATSPELTTPTIGVATATSVNKVAITAPASAATLALADGATLATSGANSLTLTTTGSTNVTLPTSGTLATLAQFSASSGSSLVGFIASITGAVLRTLQAKLRDHVTPEDAGGVGDGVTDDTTPVSSVLSSVRNWIAASVGSYLIQATSLAANKTIIGVAFVGKAANTETLRTTGTATNIKLVGVDLDALGGTAFQQNTADGGDVIVAASRIKSAGSYGFLSNSSSDGTNGVVLIGSVIYSETGDGVELNHPDGNSYNFSTIGNLITGGPTGSGSTSGFGVGIAGTQGHITALNHIKSARNEALHVEDEQTRGILAHNVISSATGEAVRVLFMTGAEPVILHGNNALHTGAKTSIYGVRLVSDGNGHLKFNAISGNVMKGFGTGYNQEGSGVQAAGDNVAIDCDRAIQVGGSGIWLGRTYASACTALAYGSNAAIIGKVVSDTNVLTPLLKSGTNMPGPYCKGWLMPFTVVHTGGGGSENFDIATLPSRMCGQITIVAGSGTQGIFYSATVHWDGTTLTLSNVISQHNGAPTSSTLTNNGGALAFRFLSASPLTLTARADFDGAWYVHS
jgi:hypothetical protein